MQSPPLAPLERPLLGDDWKSRDEQKHADAAQHELLRDPAPLSAANGAGAMQPLEVDNAGSKHDAALTSDSLPAILRNYRRTLVRLLVFSYNSFATAALSFFHTREVGEDDKRLWEYPAVSTTSPSYRAMLPLFILLLTLVVAVVPLLAVTLYLFHRREQERLAKLRTSAAEEEPESEAAALPQQRQAVLVEVMLGTFRTGYWPFAVMVLFRRLLLTTVATFVVTSTFVWLTALNTALLLLHVVTWPYRDALDNHVEALTLALLVTETTLLSDSHSNAVISTSPTTVHSVAFWFMLVLPFAAVLGSAVRLFYLRARADAVQRTGRTGIVPLMASAIGLLSHCWDSRDPASSGSVALSLVQHAQPERPASLLALEPN